MPGIALRFVLYCKTKEEGEGGGAGGGSGSEL
jgi:hypothetical protein